MPTLVKEFRFPFYINANFILDPPRQRIIGDNPWNFYLMHETAKLLVKCCSEWSQKEDYNALNLLISQELETNNSDIKQLSYHFNRAYKSALESIPFILNHYNELTTQDNIIIDKTGLSEIIGADIFCSILQTTKTLPSSKIDTTILNKDIFEQIKTGNVVMDLVKPSDIYNMWYYKSLGRNLARLILRMVPLLIITALPIWGEYRFMIQTDPKLLILSIISLLFTLLLNMSYLMLIYAFSMIFINSLSIRHVMRNILELGSGLVIPLPFMPSWMISFLKCTPFYYFQNISFSIYIGYMTNHKEIMINLIMQIIWVTVLTFLGKAIVKNRLKKLVVQGG